MWSDYPPGFLYVLALVGWVRGVFGWELLSPVFNFFTFLPAMLADLAIGYVIYRLARRFSAVFALAIAAMWVFNPAIILISSVWGQVESVFLLPLLLSLVFLREKKLLPAYLLYGAAILIKPQSLFLGPVYLFSAFDWWREHNYVWPELKRLGLFVPVHATV
jgi:Gpi18-like mannosyltransferase